MRIVRPIDSFRERIIEKLMTIKGNGDEVNPRVCSQ